MQSRSEQPFLQSRKNHHCRRREDRRRHGKHSSLHLRRRCHRKPKKFRYPQPHKRTQRSQFSILNSQFSIQRGSQRLSPFLRSRPLLAAMGRHTGQRIFRKQRKERLYRRLQMPWYLGELPFRRLCRESDGERAEHPRQHGLRLPLRCRNYTERFHHRDTRHLLYQRLQ